MVKLTFSLDETTVAELRRAADRLGKPQSQVVREAIHDYAARIGTFSEEERVRLLKIFDTVARPRHFARAAI
ncbi:MAG TPA: ribbon-helix-helix protein, CopG family [Methylomirabilota bacterium]|jgi:DNA-binding transcriptional LysR family regulator|nr:ribbon-helix-helix protein, CopG family [Methylomirabilota bacterium]